MSGGPNVSRCVYCRRQAAAAAWHPFCSERCKLQDLARWAAGAYRIPGEPVETPEEVEDLKPNVEED